LGPSLFLLYINDLPDNLTSKARLFADDTACHKDIASKDDQRHLQQDLDKLAAWKERWKMAFHPEKCLTLHITRRRTTLLGDYTLHSHQLESVAGAKYLRVTVTSDLKWDTHINSTTSKASRTLGFVRRNLKICSRKAKASAYKALVRPLLEYASPVWDPVTTTCIDSLEKIQRRAARWAMQDFRRTSSVDDMLQELNWPSLQLRRKAARLTTLYKYKKGLFHIDTRYAPTTNQKKSRRQTNSQAYDVPSHRTVYRQQTFFPRTIPEWNSLPESVATAPTLTSFRSRLQNHLLKRPDGPSGDPTQVDISIL
jgi:hypothetical protein